MLCLRFGADRLQAVKMRAVWLAAKISRMKLLAKVERVLLLAGAALLALYALAQVHSLVVSRAALVRFKASQQTASITGREGQNPSSRVDFSLWSEKRIRAYTDTLTKNFDPPLAVLRVRKIRLEAPVFDGTDDLTLNRGAGRIAGTARPGEGGNIGIAAHRDGFFRRLKEMRPGDKIELVLAGGGTENYVVDQIQIVNPDEVAVLQPQSAPAVTLVTCYPFYFIGSAPKRYIVRGRLQQIAHHQDTQ